MIPYFKQPTLSIGPLTIHAFGVMVAVAMLVGMWMVRRKATREGLSGAIADRLVTWTLLGGFAGAHLVDRLVYFPRETLADPVSLLRFWDGLSSFGGFLGAIVGTALFFRRVPPEVAEQRWRYLDAVAYGFPFGWIFGRLGCFLAFDHPGAPTSFFLGQRDRDQVVIHNLGLYEAIFTVFIAGLFALLGRRPRPPRFFVALLAVLYAPVRFLFDFLRVIDVRYLGLTPGQWGALAVLGIGVALLASTLKAARPGTPPAP